MSSSAYSVQKESERIFRKLLVDERLGLPAKVRELADKTTFDPRRSPVQLWALAATYANAIVRERYSIEQGACVNLDVATLFMVSAALVQIDGKPLDQPDFAERYERYDLGRTASRWRWSTLNVYPTKDGRFFHLHGGLNADKILTMLNLPLDRPELTDDMDIIEKYCKVIKEFDSAWLDTEANEHWRQSGSICLTTEEFYASEQGKLVEKSDGQALPPVPYPTPPTKSLRPLDGIRIVDISRVVTGPTISKLAAAYGATVLRISCDTQPELGSLLVDGNLGKRDTTLNLKTLEGRRQLQALLQDADVVDGYRPGAIDKLGFGYRYLQALARRRCKGIVHVRENCYGWHGPEAYRSGWQQISDCFTGVSWANGKFLGLDEPVVPPLFGPCTMTLNFDTITQSLWQHTN